MFYALQYIHTYAYTYTYTYTYTTATSPQFKTFGTDRLIRWIEPKLNCNILRPNTSKLDYNNSNAKINSTVKYFLDNIHNIDQLCEKYL